ncbi:MAG: type II CAAX endopeptidase family protein [Actinomycetota bacterium]
MRTLAWIFFDENARRPRAAWRLAIQFIAFVLATALFTSLIAIVSFFVAGGASSEEEALSAPLFFAGSLGSVLAILLTLYLAARYLDRRPFGDFGFHLSAGWWADLGFGLLLGALLMTLIFLLELSLGWVSVTGAFETTGSDSPFALAILLPLGIFLCVGFYEEALSRGYQLRNAAEGLNYPALGPRGAVVLAWVLSSVFFGALHAANPNATLISSLNIALAGIMLGAGYVLTGELAIPIGLHITWNFFQGNVYGFPVSGLPPIGATFVSTEQRGPEALTGGPFGPEAGFIGVTAMLLGIILTCLWVRLRYGRLAIHAPLAEYKPPAGATPAS